MMKRTRFVLGLILVIALVGMASAADTDPAKPDISKIDKSSGLTAAGIPSSYLYTTMNMHGSDAKVYYPGNTLGVVSYPFGTVFYQKYGLNNYVTLPVPSMGTVGTTTAYGRYVYLNVYQGPGAYLNSVYVYDGNTLKFSKTINSLGGGTRYYSIDMGNWLPFTRGAVIYAVIYGSSTTVSNNQFQFINGGMQFAW